MKTLRLTLLCTLLSAVVAQSAVIAFYEFEADGFLVDSSGNGNTLTNVGSMGQVAIPGTGNGSAFPTDLIANGSIADFTASSGVSGFSVADNASFGSIAASGAFTIEAYINSGTISNSDPEDSRYIAGQYSSPANDRSWAFQVNANEGLTLFLGNGSDFWGSPDSADGVISSNKDYYVAASFDVATNTATFYWQNLTDGGTLQSQTVAQTASSLGDASVDFTVGYRVGSGKRWNADGFIDSVRLSDVALPESGLLITLAPIPEPSTYAMILSAMVVLAVVHRRRRQA